MFLNTVKSSTWTFLYCTKKVRKKIKLFKSSEYRYYLPGVLLTGWSYGYYFWAVLRNLNVLSKKCRFATLGNIRQMLNVKSCLKLNVLWKVYVSLKLLFTILVEVYEGFLKCYNDQCLKSYKWPNVIAFVILEILHKSFICK